MCTGGASNAECPARALQEPQQGSERTTRIHEPFLSQLQGQPVPQLALGLLVLCVFRL